MRRARPGRIYLAFLLWLTLGAVAAPVAGQAGAVAEPAAGEETFGLFNAAWPEEGLLTAGQPTREQLEALAAAGFETVLDLRTEGEDRGFDEAKVAEELGLTYISLPVDSSRLSEEMLARFSAALESAERPLLLHCASSNRVGGLYYAWLVREGGVARDEALERGQAAGLRSPQLLERIQALLEGGASP